MFRLHDIPAVDPTTRLFNVVIDTPKGSRNKYKFDEDLGVFRLTRVLPAGMHFPYDFGSVPRSRAEDGDALDVLVLSEQATFPGCLLTVRLIGVLRATQLERGKRIRNDRLLGAVETPVNDSPCRSINELEPGLLHQIEQFFVSYNRVQGRTFRPTGRLGAAAARTMVRSAMRAYSKAAGGGGQ
jgi:inorganic pyrophosphatase